MAEKILPSIIPTLTPEPLAQQYQRIANLGPEISTAPYQRVCVPDEPQGFFSKALYSAGEAIENFSKRNGVSDSKSYLDRIMDATSFNEKAVEAMKGVPSLLNQGFKKVGAAFNVITGAGDAAVAYKDAIDDCGNPNFDVGYSVAKSVTQTVGSAITATAVTGAVASAVPFFAGVTLAPVVGIAAIGVGTAYLVGSGIDKAFDYAQPYVENSLFGKLQNNSHN